MVTTNTLFDEKSKLDPNVSKKALPKVQSYKTGKWLTEFLDAKVTVVVNYVESPAKVKEHSKSGSASAVGYCDPSPRGSNYKVWVAAGFKGTRSAVECPNGHQTPVPDGTPLYAKFRCSCGKETLPGISLIDWPTDFDVVAIARTTFHELLHAWFMTAFTSGTGHDSSVEPEVEAFGKISYSSRGYDSKFLEKLKAFDQEIGM
jgi:hypothetical protein